MIVVVGGGISGLSLGLALGEAGVPYLVLEAGQRVGGVIETRWVAEGRLELGPQRVRASPEVAPFLGELGGQRHDPAALPLFVATGESLHPVPRTLAEAIRTPALSVPGKLRAAMEPLASRLPAPSDPSAGALLRRRLGDEAYRVFIGPLFGGLYGSDPDRMDAGRTLVPALEALGIGSLVGELARRTGASRAERKPFRALPLVVPEEGMEGLVRLLYARQRDAVRLGTPARGIEATRDGYLVRTPTETIAAEQVVVTAPPAAAAELVARSAPACAEALRRLRMNEIVLVHLVVPELPPGLGFQVAFGEPLRIRGATFSGNLDGSGSTAAAFLGGMADPDAHRASDSILSATASREFEQLTGRAAHAIHVHRTAMPAWDTTWRALDGIEPPPGLHLFSNYTGRPGIVGRLREAARLARRLQEPPESASSSAARSSSISTA